MATLDLSRIITHSGPIDPNKPIILIVDDTRTSLMLMEHQCRKFIPECQGGANSKWQVVSVSSLADAAYVAFHPNLDVKGVITDNRFPLSAGLEVAATTMPQDEAEQTNEIIRKKIDEKILESSPGIMLMRLLRTGKLGIATIETEAALSGLEDTLHMVAEGKWDELVARNRNIPVVWNSGTLKKGKVASLEAVAKGHEIDLSNSSIRGPERHEEIDRGILFQKIEGTNSAWAPKGTHIVEQFAKMVQATPNIEKPEFELCARSPDTKFNLNQCGPFEFSLAVQLMSDPNRCDEAIKAARQLLEGESRRKSNADPTVTGSVSANRINQMIGWLAVIKKSGGANPKEQAQLEEILDIMQAFPRNNLEAHYKVHTFRDEQEYSTPLFEAVVRGSKWIVEKLLQSERIVVHQDAVDRALKNPELAPLMEKFLEKHEVTPGRSYGTAEELKLTPEQIRNAEFGFDTRKLAEATAGVASVVKTDSLRITSESPEHAKEAGKQ